MSTITRQETGEVVYRQRVDLADSADLLLRIATATEKTYREIRKLRLAFEIAFELEELGDSMDPSDLP